MIDGAKALWEAGDKAISGLIKGIEDSLNWLSENFTSIWDTLFDPELFWQLIESTLEAVW